ncbi:unnamed protein product [Didymodactylos carnosus]|uniref:F-box domain-containing protein n=1 Tax=Didymodactylos carnosus TaxID=1234261 RepID=A0A816BXZ7_9BILA|nr:unnamed protein product [Didymodactylos carnosus]CAF1614872.1 unnamed protein product [Didymodactylos carnosus]CAF4325341.1 unnamed protein product [Didymodactylos carnosus]CAF4500387.1 unnamed protein product [Didymodactylos carnosus]
MPFFTFDALLNELHLNLLTYLTITDSTLAFFNLNSRFNSLIHQSFRYKTFDFTNVTQQAFDEMLKFAHTEFLHKIYSLKLSDLPTVGAIDHFISHFNIRHLSNLQSLFLHEPVALQVKQF